MNDHAMLLSLCVLGVLGGLFLLWRGFGGYRTAVAVGDTSTSSIASLAAGECRVVRDPAHREPRLLARQLVGLGDDDDQRNHRRCPGQQLAIEVGQFAANVHHQDDAGERTAAADVVAGQRLPRSLRIG